MQQPFYTIHWCSSFEDYMFKMYNKQTLPAAYFGALFVNRHWNSNMIHLTVYLQLQHMQTNLTAV